MNEDIRSEYLADTDATDEVPFKRLLPASMVIAKILCTQRMDVIEQFGLNESHIWDPQYKELYIYIKDHYNRYNQVPDIHTLLREDKFQLIIDSVSMQVSEPDIFLRDQLWEDYMFHKTAAVLQQAARLTEINSKEGVDFLNQQMVLLNQEIKPGGVDIIQQARERLDVYNQKRSSDNYYIPTGFPQLDDKICGWSPGEELVVLVARTGVGKEQPLYSKVLTPTGWKHMRDMHVGDIVITGTGDYAKVVGVFPQGVKPVYRITFTDGTFVDAGLEHLWTVQSRVDRLGCHSGSASYQVVTTKHMIENIEDDWTVNLVDPVVFSNSEPCMDLDPYLIGVLLSTGFDMQLDEVVVTLNRPTVVDRVKRILKRKYGCKLIRYRGFNQYKIVARFHSKNSVVNVLDSLGFRQRSDVYRFIPQVYLQADYGVRSQIVSGLMDNVAENKQGCMYSLDVDSRTLADDLQELLGSLGIWNKRSRIWDLPFVCDRFSVKLPVNILHEEKLVNAWSAPRSYKRHIRSIEYVNEFECQCIMVDHPSHTYITDNYTITHNTWVMTKMLTEAWRNNLNVGLIEPEMTGTKIGYRFDTIFKGFSNRKLSYARDLEGEYSRYENYIDELEKNNTKFCVAHPKDFGGSVTVSMVKQWCKSNDIKVLGIDGISYIKDERGRSSAAVTTALTNISADLMEVSIELGIPIIIVVQSNRGSIETGGRPTLETIRDSDGIAYSASMVYSLYIKNDALHISMLKNRNGDSNITLAYDWDIDTGRFEFLQEGEVDGPDDDDSSGPTTHNYSNEGGSSGSSSHRPDRTSYSPTGMTSEQVHNYERVQLEGTDVF